MDAKQHSGARLKARLIVALIMFILGFAGVIATDISKEGAWHYWEYLAVIYAILGLFLSWQGKRKGWKAPLISIWHEIAHWIGLIAAVIVASYFVRMGLIGRFEASVFTLLLLALATYLAGIYIESTLILVGIALGIFSVAIAFLDAYLYNILLPIAVVIVLVLVFMIRHAHKKSLKEVG